MEARLDYEKAAPGAMKAMMVLQNYSKNCGLEPALLELVKVRAAQLNGCAYCVDMHTKDARVGGETEQRLYALSVWRETPFYTERERAALEFTEAVTLIAVGHVPNEDYQVARKQFSEEELVNLVMNIITINAWNRLAITFRDVPGTYEPKRPVSTGESVRA
jgi:AhpD family alkylhydroperoxidase